MEVDSGLVNDEYSVRWSNHHRSLVSVVERFYADEAFTDCSLAVDGEEICAHKIILSACSPFLNALLRKHREKHPIILLRDVSPSDLHAVVEYMYKGQVQVPQERLQSFLKVAQSLQVAGLVPLDDEKLEKTRTWSETSGEHSDSPERALTPLTDPKEDCGVNEDDGQVEYLSEGSGPDKLKEEEEDYSWLLVEEQAEQFKNEVVDVQTTTDGNRLIELPSRPPRTTRTSVRRDSRSGRSFEEEELPPQLLRAQVACSDEYNMRCSQCGGIYRTETTFLNHLRHDCNKIHTCYSCAKVFKNKRHLLDHVRDDCGRVHVCPQCDRTFKQKVNLTTHQKHYCKKPTKSPGRWSGTLDKSDGQVSPRKARLAPKLLRQKLVS